MFSRTARPFSPMKLLGTFVMSRWPLYLIGVLSVALTDLAQILVPYFTGQLVDLVTKTQGSFEIDKLYEIFTNLVIAVTTLATMRFAWRFFLGRQTHHAAHWLKSFVYDNLRFMPEVKFQKDYSVGEVMSLSTSDADYARYLFGFTMVGFLDTFFLGAFCLVMIGMTDLDVLMWCTLFFALHPWLCKKLADKEIRLFHHSQEELADLNDLAGQTVQSIRMQRMTNSGNLWTRLLNDKAEKYRQGRLKAAETSLLYTPLMGSMEVVVYIIVFVVGIDKVINGSLSIGQFVALQSYILILQGPIIQLGFVLSDMQRARTSLARLSRAYNEPEDEMFNQKENLQENDLKEIVFEVKNLNFHFSDHSLFSDLNFNLKSCNHLGIRGEIGSGKTTLIKILAGLERRFDGQVLLSGKDIRKYRHEDLRKQISIVTQNPFLFGDTIKNNISLDQDLSEDEIWSYLEMADVAQDVKGFEHGLNTIIGENGITLSGGQKQRLTLARALARNPQILILDDALSAIDIRTESKILKKLKEQLNHMTVIWVAHRESTLSNCDQIIELGSR